MTANNKNPNNKPGCGCGSIPIFPVLLLLIGGGWWVNQAGYLREVGKYIPANIPFLGSSPSPPPPKPVDTGLPPVVTAPPTIALEPSPPPPTPSNTPSSSPSSTPSRNPTAKPSPAVAAIGWEKKEIRGIYLSRYQITNNASEAKIRQRVRYYKSQGFNTIIHGVWGNGCTMYPSEALQKLLGYRNCPNQFQEKWLDWLIDEAHAQNMQVHAYFEKGIKIDKDSPMFDLAVQRKWLVPGVDRTYANVEHYVLDVEVPAVGELFTNVLTEFVKKYPKIDAVQWDDYLGYHAELPGKVDRTAKLTQFVRTAIASAKAANPRVKFDICHHNPYWAKRYFAADWQQWQIDRAFIQAYSEQNFSDELKYAQANAGIAITDLQLHRLKELIANPRVKSILVFALSGDPEKLAADVNKIAKEK
jgi:uncharacterized lipoprotein YddW (UPF0748 family)